VMFAHTYTRGGAAGKRILNGLFKVFSQNLVILEEFDRKKWNFIDALHR